MNTVADFLDESYLQFNEVRDIWLNYNNSPFPHNVIHTYGSEIPPNLKSETINIFCETTQLCKICNHVEY